MRRVEVADEARRIAPRGIHQRIESLCVQHRVHGYPYVGAHALAAQTPGARLRYIRARRRVAQTQLHSGMKAPAAHNVRHGLHRRVGRARGEVPFKITPEAIAAALLTALDGVEGIDAHRIDYHGAGATQIGHSLLEYTIDFGVERGAVVRLPQNSNACTLERTARERRTVVRRTTAVGSRCHAIRRVAVRDHIEHSHRVGHAARHRPSNVCRRVERDDAGTRREPHGAANTHQRLMARRPANGVAGVGAQTQCPESRRHGRGRTSARARSHTIERVGIFRVPRQNAAHRFVRRERPLGKIALRQHDRAGSFHLSHHRGVLQRFPPFERERPARGLQPHRFEVVLHDERDAMQRPHGTPHSVRAIERVCRAERIGIGRHDAVDRRPAFVERFDAGEILLHERPAGQTPCLERPVNGGDGRRVDGKATGRGLPLGSTRRRDQRRGRQNDCDT